MEATGEAGGLQAGLMPKTKDLKQTASQAEDEANKILLNVLRPIKSANVVKEWGRTEYFDNWTTAELEYISATQGIEINTQRSQLLQTIADRMLEGSGMSTKIVILNKGLDPNGFILPDGTMCISQSAINMADNLDEVAALVAHEVEHILNKTFEMKVRAGTFMDKIGVGWLHEMAGDALAPTLLEKTGYNSMAFGSMVKKIQDKGRGILHQGGLMRSASQVGVHYGIDFDTSSKPLTPLPAILRKEAIASNIEIAMELLSKGSPEEYVNLIGKLHPGDLPELYSQTLAALRSDDVKSVFSRGKYISDHERKMEALRSIISRRLVDNGCNGNEVKAFFFGISEFSSFERGMDFISSPEELTAVIEAAGDLSVFDKFNVQTKYMDVYRKAFRRYPVDNKDRVVLERVLQHLAMHLVEYDENPRGQGIPVNTDILLDALTVAAHHQGHPVYQGISYTEIIFNHIDKLFLDRISEYPVSQEQLEELFREVKERGIPLDYNWIQNYYHEDADGNEGVIRTASDRKKIENRKLAVEAYRKANELTGTHELKTLIDDFFRFSDEYPYNYLENFLDNLDMLVRKTGMKLPEIQELSDYYYSKIDSLTRVNVHDCPYSEILEEPRMWEYDQTFTPEERDLNEKLLRFQFKLWGTMSIFRNDSPEFYDRITRIMETSGIEPDKLSRYQLINLCQSILIPEDTGYKDPGKKKSLLVRQLFAPGGSGMYLPLVPVTDITRLSSLPFIREIMRKDPETASDIPELFGISAKLIRQHRSVYANGDPEVTFGFFRDGIDSLLIGRGIRLSFSRILEKDIPFTHYKDLYGFIDDYFPASAQKTRYLRSITDTFLHSREIPLGAKIDFLSEHFDTVGIEGAVTLAEQIDTFPDYLTFRIRLKDKLQSYLEGSENLGTAALVDYAVSEVISDPTVLFKTCIDNEHQRETVNTKMAENWLNAFQSANWGKAVEIQYEPAQKRFHLDNRAGLYFRSYPDIVATLQNLSPSERFAITLKALVDVNGMLTSEEKRSELMEIATTALGRKKGFMADILRETISDQDAEFIAYPLAQALAPLLFRNLSADAINFEQLKDKNEKKQEGSLRIPDADLPYVFSHTTKDLIEWGAAYKKHPGSEFSRLALESDEVFADICAKLDRLLLSGQDTGENIRKTGTMAPEDEAAISGAEMCGAPVVRGMQISAQIGSDIAPDVRKRFSRALDSRKGLNKLLFWENLTRLGEKDSRVADFLNNRLAKLGDYRGGGSLYTTYACRVKTGNGGEIDAVARQLNPNAKAFVKETAEIGTRVFTRMNRYTTGKEKKYTRLGRILMDLSYRWCIADIEDPIPQYEEDDDRFRQVIGEYLRQREVDNVFAPERLFTHEKLKVEESAGEITMNQFLQDEETDAHTRQRTVEEKSDFFHYQLSQSSWFTDEKGRKYRIVHSDPTVGNEILRQNGESLEHGIIDRNMYLHLYEEDINLLDLFMQGDNRRFIDAFIKRIFDENGVSDEAFRNRMRMQAMAAIAIEYGKQRLRGQEDRFMLLDAVHDTLTDREFVVNGEKRKLKVPVKLDLMIRNIEVDRELTQEYPSHD